MLVALMKLQAASCVGGGGNDDVHAEGAPRCCNCHSFSQLTLHTAIHSRHFTKTVHSHKVTLKISFLFKFKLNLNSEFGNGETDLLK